MTSSFSASGRDEDDITDEAYLGVISAIERGEPVNWTRSDRVFMRYADAFVEKKEARSPRPKRRSRLIDRDPYGDIPDDIQNDPRPRDERDFPLFD